MATSEDIAQVRLFTAEPLEDTFNDTYVGEQIDAGGVLGAAKIIWEAKAAEAAELVNTSEAGASHSFSDMHKNALNMVKYFTDQIAAGDPDASSGHVRVKKIVRQ